MRINNAYPRFKEWLSNGHPYPNIPDVYLLCGIGKKDTGRRLSDRSFNAFYNRYKDEHFPKLLTDPTLSEED